MIKVGDRVTIDRPLRRNSVGTVLEVEFNRGAYALLVRRDDNGLEDVWVFHMYQVGVSVHIEKGLGE